MTEPRELLDALSVPFPPHAIERREGGGGRMLDYVATETVIRRLNSAVGVWDFKITETKVMPAGDSQLLVVWGELTVPGLGTRSGTGVQVIHPRGGEDMWKGAASDCLKKCATLFNVGIDLYGPDLEAGEMPANIPDRTRSTSTNTISNDQGVRPQARAGLPPTDKQSALIHVLARKLDMSDDDLHQFAGVASLLDLDRKDVSSLIDRLKALEADGPDDGDQESPVFDWTTFWANARSMGYPNDKAKVEELIGNLGHDPQNAMTRLMAVKSEQRALA